MASSRRALAAPLIVSVVAGLALAAMLVVFFAALRPYTRDHTPAQFSATEKDAVTAASTETVNLLSFRRAHFAADYARALDGATGSFRSEIAGQRAKTLQTLTKGKFDLFARPTHQALVGPAAKSRNGYVVLVTVNGYKTSDPNVPTQQSLQVTVVHTDGKWLVDDVQNIGIS